MLLATAFAPTHRADVSWSPLDDRWYMPTLGIGSDAGVAVGPQTLWLCDVVLAAVRFKANSFAMCSPDVLERTARGKKTLPDHPVHKLLRNPNAWQTAFLWQQSLLATMSTWGNAHYELKTPGGAGELWALDPTRVRVKSQMSTGELVYEYIPPGGGAARELVGGVDLLHFRDFSVDGQAGLPIYQLIRNIVGIALAAEKHAAKFLSKGVRISGLITGPTLPTKEQRDAMSESFSQAFGGTDNVGRVAVVGGGLDFKPLSMDHRGAQFLELRDFQVQSVLRALGVPGVAVGYQGDKASTYASAKEFFQSGGIRHCLQPALTSIEQQIHKDLMFGDPRYLVRFNMDVLMRADTKERYEALFRATGVPFMTVNEARDVEGWNAAEDPKHDQIAVPVNMKLGDDEPAAPPARRQLPPPRPAPADDDVSGRAVARFERFAVDASARVVRRELAAINGGPGKMGLARRFARDVEAFRAAVVDFYAKHAAFVVEALHLPQDKAEQYCSRQRDAVLAGGRGVCETWEETVIPELAEIALDAPLAAAPAAPAPQQTFHFAISPPSVTAPITVEGSKITVEAAPTPAVNISSPIVVPNGAFAVDVRAQMPDTIEIRGPVETRVTKVPETETTVSKRDSAGRVVTTRKKQV